MNLAKNRSFFILQLCSFHVFLQVDFHQAYGTIRRC